MTIGGPLLHDRSGVVRESLAECMHPCSREGRRGSFVEAGCSAAHVLRARSMVTCDLPTNIMQH